MRCPGVECLLLLLASLAIGAEPGSGTAFIYPELPALPLVQFDLNDATRSNTYRLTLGLVPARSADMLFLGLGAGGVQRALAAGERPIAGTVLASRARFLDGDGASLLPLLSLEAKGERLEFKPRRHSLAVQWRKSFF